MLKFFSDNFGRHLLVPSGDLYADTSRVLSMTHPIPEGKDVAQQRISSGWAILRQDRTPTMQMVLLNPAIEYSHLTRYEAFLAELEAWDGTPRMFLEFSKRPIPVTNLYRTFDTRQVRICSAEGVETFDFTREPAADGCRTHKVIWKKLLERQKFEGSGT